MTETIVSDPAGNRFRLERIACVICKERDLRSIGMRGGKYQRGGRGIPLEIVQCRRCDLMWADPFPYPVDPSGLYGDPAKYFAHQDSDKKVESARSFIIEAAIRHSGKARPSLLDVGCGRAELLRAAKASGLDDVIGLEFAQGMIDYARDEHGIVLVAKTIEAYAEEAGRTFDVVTFSAVLEHVYDPDAAIAAARTLLNPGGVLYLDTPREPNVITMLGKAANWVRRNPGVLNLSPTFSPFHVFGFNERSTAKLLAKHNFELISTWIHSEMGFVFPDTLRGRAMKAAVKSVGYIANRTGIAANMYTWARRN